MAKLFDLARMTTATTGTGTITLGSAATGFITFANAGVSNGDTVTYAIEDGANREIGRGVYTSSGTTLTRATILRSTNSNAAISLSGTAQVFIAASAEDISPQTATEQSTVRTTLYAAPYDAISCMNYFINGAQEINQQFGTSGTRSVTSADNANDIYMNDQWWSQQVLTAGTFNIKQSTDAPTGFSKSLEFNAAGTQSLGTNDYITLGTLLEGTHVASLAFGTASAPTLTLGFWVKSNKTGTFTVGIADSIPTASAQAYRHTFTINAVDTWEFKTFSFAGDTAHTWAADTTNSIVVWACFGAGSGKQSATVDSWDTTTPTAVASTSQSYFLGATSDYVRFTGAFLVPTADQISSARSVLFRNSFARDLLACQRYYETSYNLNTAVGTATGVGAEDYGHRMSSATFAADIQQARVTFKVMKRTTPTIVMYSPSTGTSAKARDIVAAVDVNAVLLDTGASGFSANLTPNAANANLRLQFHWAANSRM